jgi:hypothetical protein
MTRGSRLAYAATVFLSAFLLFQIQPMVGKLLTPWFGGTPAVWTTCMLFFQSLLVLGYAYAHLVVRRLAPSRQRLVHLAALAVALIVLGAQAFAWGSAVLPPSSWKPVAGGVPALTIVLVLAASVGAGFLLLSATGPLLQGWFARTHPGVSAYRLYALSNLGSLLALLTYPLLVEPLLSLRAQALAWSAGFAAFAVLCGWCAFGAGSPRAADSGARPDDDELHARPDWVVSTLWIALAGCASMLLLAVTNHVCQDVAVVPFLWVLPLGLYLLSLIACFEWERLYHRGLFMWLLAASLVASAVVLKQGLGAKVPTQLLAYSTVLFLGCMVCHGELVRLRPGRHHLTAFYLLVSLGGAAGGIFVGVIAPRLFAGLWELHMALALTAALAVIVLVLDRASWLHGRRPWPAAIALAGAVGLMDYASAGSLLDATPRKVIALEGAAVLGIAAWLIPGSVVSRWRLPGSRVAAMGAVALSVAMFAVVLGRQAGSDSGAAMLRSRTFFGVISVMEEDASDPEDHAFRLQHGRIVHGAQFQALDRRALPTTYYGSQSGVGLAIVHHPRRADLRPLRIGVVGLGVGTLAAHARAGDYLRFYEINPDVIALSRGRDPLFTYLADAPAEVDVVAGDARLALERELDAGTPQRFDVLALDAFSSDSVPVHLLTREAMTVYLRHLRDEQGIVAVHVSNRFLDLRPVVWALADHFGLASALIETSGEDSITWGSTWILLARDPDVLGQEEIEDVTTARNTKKKPRLWTDDHSGLWQVVKW